MISSHLFTLVCLLVLTHLPTHSTQPEDTSNGTNNENLAAHCVPMPPGLRSICSTDLGWSTRMQLPNLLGHKSYEELNSELSSMTILQAENLHKLECNSLDQLKLVLCATIAPGCFDAVLPPCRQTCLRAKAGCRSSLQRHNIVWPKALDCRRLPATPEICVSRMVPFSAKKPNEQLMGVSDATESPVVRKNKHKASASSKRRRKPKKEAKFNATTTGPPSSLETDSTTTKEAVTTTEEPPFVPYFNHVISRNTTSNDILTDDKSLTLPVSSSPPTSPMTETSTTTTRPTTTTVASETTTSATLQTTTTSTPASSDAAPIPHNLSETATKVGLADMKAEPSASLPPNTSVTIAKGLTSFLCASSPDWLIKTKLTDNQLMAATKKRKLRVRSYRQIFGSFTNSSSIKSTNGSTSVSRAARSKSGVASSVCLSLSNSTSFIYPLGSSLYCQLMSNDSSSQDNQHADESNSTSSSGKSQSKTYLILGASHPNGTKIASYIVLWPGTKFSKDLDVEASADIVKTYRDFKLRQLAACQQDAHLAPRSKLAHSQHDSVRVSKRNHYMTSTMSTMTNSHTWTGDPGRADNKRRQQRERA